MGHKVGIIGLGYVGLPLAFTFLQRGYSVIGVDLDESKIRALSNGQSYLPDISDETLFSYVVQKQLIVTADYASLSEVEAVIICVPTPLTPLHTPDLSYLVQVGSALSKHLKQDQLIVLESSTYPGTTREVLQPLLEKSGLKIGIDYYLAYSPERIDPGRSDYTLETIPKIISGITNRCADKVFGLYSTVFAEVVLVSSPEAAEMAKLLENSYRFVNISFINEFAMLCDKMKIDVWEVIDAAKTKPYGFKAFYPGPGIGGHCIPVDPLYLQWSANLLGSNSKFIDYAHSINISMPNYIVGRIKASMGVSALVGMTILVIGVSYKRNINDTRESSALSLMKIVIQEGAHLSYSDPLVPEVTVNGETLMSLELNEQNLSEADCVVIVTDHSELPIQLILDHSKLVYDTRNITHGLSGKARIIRLGTGI
ncbi:nucleotide sugar dehydrogenase [Cohnella sp. WQ 127256]|uniref:nucleotide sugar dehydrogenase n=1 Tax=Cohnella sp. WQ 127256 TaxID=2938790 RepID=UPI0021175924|nr:nucleotide sugar dehydrogenase [Cohnella sp. WQ 127256]